MKTQATVEAPPGAAPTTQGASTPAPAQPLRPPATKAELQALIEQRANIGSQLGNVTGRRNDLANSLSDVPADARAGVQQRISALDDRILLLESQLESTGQQVIMANSTLMQSATSIPFGLSTDQVTAISIVFTITVLMPFAVGMARLMFRRTFRPQRSTPTSDSSPRIERIEQAVDAIAIEVERVSEGQRFMTKLLSEAHATPIPIAQQQESELLRAGRR